MGQLTKGSQGKKLDMQNGSQLTCYISL